METLRPYSWPAESRPPVLRAYAERTTVDTLKLTYSFESLPHPHLYRFEPPSQNPMRKDDLWKSTCFEAFVSVPAREEYWEMNASSAGHWNVYGFERYRHRDSLPMDTEASVSALTSEPEKPTWQVTWKLPRALQTLAQGLPLQIGITAVLELTSGSLTYWAIRHDGPQPDFHLRSSFVILLK